MKTYKLVLAVIVAVFSAQTAAEKKVQQVSGDRKFVGFSEALVAGNSGYPAINQACRDSFGVGARICVSQEIIATIQPPVESPSSPEAWVRIEVDTNTLGDVVGWDSTGWNDNGVNCAAFKSNNSNDANRVGELVVSAATGELLLLRINPSSSQARFFAQGRCSDSRAVACCQ